MDCGTRVHSGDGGCMAIDLHEPIAIWSFKKYILLTPELVVGVKIH